MQEITSYSKMQSFMSNAVNWSMLSRLLPFKEVPIIMI